MRKLNILSTITTESLKANSLYWGEIRGTRQRFVYILPPPQIKAAHSGAVPKVLFPPCKGMGSSPQWGGWPACPASGSGWPGAPGCSPRRRQTGGSAAAPRPPSAAGRCPLQMTCRLPQQLNHLPQLLRAHKQHTGHFGQWGSHSGTSHLIEQLTCSCSVTGQTNDVQLHSKNLDNPKLF